MKILGKIIPLSLLTPLLAFAQGTNPGNLGGIKTFMVNVMEFMNGTLVPFVFALAFLVFLWGVFKTFILGGSDPEKQGEGKQLMMYAIAGFVVMISLWGIVNLFVKGFGLEKKEINTDIPNLPTTR